MSSEREEKGIDRNLEISSTKEIIKLDATPNLFQYSLTTKYNGCGS